MNQQMHSWVAMVLITVTITIIQGKKSFIDADDGNAWKFLIAQSIAQVIGFGLCFYMIN